MLDLKLTFSLFMGRKKLTDQEKKDKIAQAKGILKKAGVKDAKA